jgi:hypothetical protein
MADQPETTVDKRVKQAIDIRDALKKLDDRHAAERKPLADLQEAVLGWLQSAIDKAGATSIRTQHGTCIASTRYTASLADPEAFMNYVKQTQNWGLMDRRANATGVQEFVKANGTLPPGCNLNAMKTVGVRRPTKKGEPDAE